MGDVSYADRAELELDELRSIFEKTWGSPKPNYERVLERSFTWISARDAHGLVGFVNVAWDGAVHFFLLDTTVHP